MNKDFLSYMQDMLKDEYDSFIKAYDKPYYKGFNVNTLKLDSNDLFKYLNIEASLSPYHQDSYIYEGTGFGNSLAQNMGLLYFQEPSASLPVYALDIKPDDRVLDLCSAPGGKSIQIAMLMNEKGLLISNEVNANRANILVSNIERMGISNCTVTSSPTSLFPQYLFESMDKVLVDAPCSGEGMFRKSPSEEWNLKNVYACQKRQLDILEDGYKCLKKDGILVYSTCTFNEIENKGVVEELLKRHPDLSLEETGINHYRRVLDKCIQVLPMDIGEGQFIAKFKKHAGNSQKSLSEKPKISNKYFKDFTSTYMTKSYKYTLEVNNRIYVGDRPFYDLGKIRILRDMVYAGQVKKDRFEPHHHLYMASFKKDGSRFKDYLDLNEDQALAYQVGNTLSIKGYKGYISLLYKGQILGFGKGDMMIIKNKYPKGLRKDLLL